MSDEWRLREWVPPEPGRRGSNGHDAVAPGALSYPDFPDLQPFQLSTPVNGPDTGRPATPALPNGQPPPFNPKGLVRPPRGITPSRFNAAPPSLSALRLPPRYLPPVPSPPPGRLLPPVLPRPPLPPASPAPPARPVTERPPG
jgi:hypothetical protein